jgi:hypothetical protein
MNDYSSNNSSNNFDNSSRAQSSLSRKKIRRFVKRSTILPFALVGIVVIIVAVVLLKNAAQTTNAVSVPTLSGDKRINIEKPKADQKLNKVYNFPLRDQNGKEVSKFSYEIQNAELRDEIVVKGQKATAVKGRTFLIVNLKITNNFDKNIQLNVKDYIRLTTGNSTEKFAPDIHNDPVDVQAISTKYTRVGFPINDTDKNLTLQVGEITGSKETIKLTL